MTLMWPLGSFSDWATVATTPMAWMSSGRGSSSWGSFWAERKSRLPGVARAASRAWIDESRPTTKGAIMCGNTTMSRSGTSGRTSPVRVVISFDLMELLVLPWPRRRRTARGAASKGGEALPRLAENRDGVRVVLDHVLGNDAFLDVLVRRDLVHHVEHEVLDDDLQTPCPDVPGESFLGDGFDGVIGKTKLDVLEFQHRLILLDERVLRLSQDLDERSLIELCQGRDHRKAADELGDHSVLDQVLRVHLLEQDARPLLLLRSDLRPEAHRLLGHAPADDVLEADEGASAEEQDVRGVDLDELLVWMLAPSLRRHVGDRPLQDLQKRLLDPFSR